MKKNNPQKFLGTVVPIVIATFVLWLFQTGPFANQPQEKKKGESLYKDLRYPIGENLVFRYTTRGVFRGNSQEETHTCHRKIIRKIKENQWQAADSFKDQVIDNYYLTKSDRGIELTSTGLNKKRYKFLPQQFGLNATWQVSKTLRATADGVPEDLEITVSINGKPKEFLIEAIRVRYDRYYPKEVTTKPDWYFEGYTWFARGLGIVKEDSTNVEIPKPNGKVSFKDTWEIKELVAIEGYR